MVRGPHADRRSGKERIKMLASSKRNFDFSRLSCRQQPHPTALSEWGFSLQFLFAPAHSKPLRTYSFLINHLYCTQAILQRSFCRQGGGAALNSPGGKLQAREHLLQELAPLLTHILGRKQMMALVFKRLPPMWISERYFRFLVLACPSLVCCRYLGEWTSR